MDDLAIPLQSEQQVRDTLQTLYVYSTNWALSFSPEKTKVLCFNVVNPPIAWQFGSTQIPTVHSETCLSVVFTDDRKWFEHYETKLAKANKAVNILRGSGLIGGKQPVNAVSALVQAKVWPKLDNGRAVADISGRGYKTLRNKIDSFLINLGREILGLSKSAIIDAVLGELGWTLNSSRAELLRQRLLTTFASSPQGSLPSLIYNVVTSIPVESRPPLFSQRTDAQNVFQYDFSQNGKRHLKRQFREWASNEWADRVADQPRLIPAYGRTKRLKIQDYLCIGNVIGRRLLTKLRADDLPLEGASYNTRCPRNCPICQTEKETREHFLVCCTFGPDKTFPK